MLVAGDELNNLIPVNIGIVEVLAAAIAAEVIGVAWYTVLFGKMWAALSGVKMTEESKKKAMPLMVLHFIGLIITAYVLAHFLNYANALTNVTDALLTAFWAWLGFQAVLLLNSVIYEQKPVKLFLINAGYQLLALLAMALIIYYL